MRMYRRHLARHHQQGFTLVEIGVVLVIIGLLLGAVLKGQEMIASARVTNLAQSINGYRAAINGFQDRYRMMPGNSSVAATKVGTGAVNCTATCDDGFIEAFRNTSLVNNHMSVAGFYSGPSLSAEAITVPTATGYLNNSGGAPIFAAYYDQFSNPGGGFGGNFQHGVYTGWNLSSKMLGELDRKIDDGIGWTGAVRFAFGGGLAATCLNTTSGVWLESSPGANCSAVLLF